MTGGSQPTRDHRHELCIFPERCTAGPDKLSRFYWLGAPKVKKDCAAIALPNVVFWGPHKKDHWSMWCSRDLPTWMGRLRAVYGVLGTLLSVQWGCRYEAIDDRIISQRTLPFTGLIPMLLELGSHRILSIHSHELTRSNPCLGSLLQCMIAFLSRSLGLAGICVQAIIPARPSRESKLKSVNSAAVCELRLRASVS